MIKRRRNLLKAAVLTTRLAPKRLKFTIGYLKLNKDKKTKPDTSVPIKFIFDSTWF